MTGSSTARFLVRLSERLPSDRFFAFFVIILLCAVTLSVPAFSRRGDYFQPAEGCDFDLFRKSFIFLIPRALFGGFLFKVFSLRRP